MKERVAPTRQTPGSALHRDPPVLAELALAELRKVGKLEIDVIGYEEVEFAVIIVVTKSGSRRPARVIHARFLGDVAEGSVAVVVIKVVRPQASDVQIFVTVSVKVGCHHTHGPAGID